VKAGRGTSLNHNQSAAKMRGSR